MAKPRKTSAKGVDVADSYAVRLMQHLVVPTFVIDPKRRVVIWNRACERLTGVPAAEVIGTTKHWRSTVPSSCRSFIRNMPHAATTGSAFPRRTGA